MAKKLTPKDFMTQQDIRWCPGCGDFAILKQVQIVLPQLEIPKENIVFISGIGCNSRFPYYMNTYGMHSIHGRATAIASGLKLANPDLSVWVITGDGDALSIGGNHLIHLLRRNFNVNVLLFNNQIYGLTKGQYSPTSEKNKVSKSTPLGSIDHPFNPLALALGANATFIARSIDREAKHLQSMLKQSHDHIGTSLLEIYQNCNIFNDGAFTAFTDRASRKQNVIFLEDNMPLQFGNNNELGIKLDGYIPQVVSLNDGFSVDDLWIHDKTDLLKAQILVRFFEGDINTNLPRPFGVIYEKEKSSYEQEFFEQINQATHKKGQGSLQSLVNGNENWVVE